MSTHPETALAWLAGQQRRVRGIVDGLDDDQMRATVLPSGWTCQGMLAHLTSTTRFWLQDVMLDVHTSPEVADDFVVPDGARPGELVDTYARVCVEGAAGVAALPGNTPPAWWPGDRWGPWRLQDLDEVLLHLLVETSTHAGHLDAARELLDGGTWDFATASVAVPA